MNARAASRRGCRFDRRVLAATAAVGMCWPGVCVATNITYNWADGSSDWTTPGNWNPKGIPGDSDYVDIVDADTTSRTILYDYAGAAANYIQVAVSNTGGGNEILQIINGERLSATTESIGGYFFSALNGAGTGVLTQAVGANLASTLNLGYNAGDGGGYTLSGTGTLDSPAENVGLSGTGTFTQSGGINGPLSNFASLEFGDTAINVGVNAGSVGTYNLGGTGVINIAGQNLSETVGVFGAGTFNQSGGTNNIGVFNNAFPGTNALYVGYNAGAIGTYNLSGGSLVSPPTLSTTEVIGFNGNGNFNQTSGTNNPTDGTLVLGDNAGSTGTYTLSGDGTLMGNGLEEEVGNSGTGNFSQTGGFNDPSAASILIGGNAGGNGTYSLSGTGSISIQGFEYVGYMGTGTFIQTSGANRLASTSEMILGRLAGATGSYSLSGTGILSVAGLEYVGYLGVGNFVQTGGSNTLSGGAGGNTLYVGEGASGAYTLSGTGTLSVAGTEYIGFGDAAVLAGVSNGTFDQTGGTHRITGNGVNLYLGYNAGAMGNYVLSNTGTLTISGNEVVGSSGVGTFSQSGGSNQITGALAVANKGGSTGSYLLSGTGSLTASNVYVGGSASGVGGTGLLSVGGGIVNVSQSITVYNGAGTSLTISNGGVTATALDLAGGAFVQSGGSATFEQINGTGQATISGGITTLSAGVVISQVHALSLSGVGTLDITNNALVINFASPGSDPVTAIRAALSGGYNGGHWTGTGITSSSAGAKPAMFSVGYADGNVDSPSLAGLNQFLIAYTVAGDANLDGSVGFADLVAVAQNFGGTGRDWAEGNFTYDPAGSVGFADLVLVAQLFGESTPVATEAAGSGGLSPVWEVGAGSVPEPGVLQLGLACWAGLITRRRKVHRTPLRI